MKYSCPSVLALETQDHFVSVQQYTVNIHLVACDVQSGCISATLNCPDDFGVFQLVREGGELKLISDAITLTGPIDGDGNFVISLEESRVNGVGCPEGIVLTLTGHLEGNSISGTAVTQIDEANDGPSGPCATDTCPDQYVDQSTFTGTPV